MKSPGAPKPLARRVEQLSILISTLSTLLLGGIAAAIIWLHVEADTERRLEEASDFFEYRFREQVGVPLQAVFLLASSPLVVNAIFDVAPMSSYLGDLLGEQRVRAPRIRALSVHDHRGHALGSDGPPDPLVNEAIASAGNALSFTDDGTLRLAVPIVVPRIGTVEGALLVEMDLAGTMADSLQRDATHGDMVMSLRGRATGAEIWRTPSGPHNAPSRIVSRALSIDGVGRVATLELGLTERAAWAPLRYLVAGTIASMLVTLLLSLLLSRLLADRLARPIRELATEAERLASDPTAQPSDLDARDSTFEMWALSHAIRRMFDAASDYRWRLAKLLESRTLQLENTESKLSDILGALDDVAFSSSAGGASLYYASPSLRRLMDWESNDAEKEALWQALLAATNGAPVDPAGGDDTIVSLRTLAGREKAIRIRRRIVPLPGPADGAHRIDGLIADITAQQAAERERVAAFERLELVERALRASPSGLAVIEVAGGAFSPVYANPVYEELVPRGLPGPAGQDAAGQVPGGDEGAQPALEAARNAMRDGTTFSVVLRLTAAPEGERWGRFSVAAVPRTPTGREYRVAVLQDITERVLAQRRLADWAQRVDAVFTMSPDGFACFNGSGRLVAINPAMCEVMGVRPPDAIGWTESRFANFLVERSSSLTADALSALGLGRGEPDPAAAEGRPPIAPATAATAECGLEFDLGGPRGRIVRMQIRSYHGDAEAKVVYLHDVTRERQVEQMKSDFLSTAAHELRTPMASLLGYAELLQRRNLPDTTRSEMLDIIRKQTARLAKLLDELLDLARIEARGSADFRFRKCRIESIVHEAFDAIAADGDRREVSLDMPADLPALRVDPEKIQQALLNVLSNAYKYSKPDAQIRMSVRALVAGDGTGELVIVVSDQGIGMSPEDAARVFERFYRAERTGKIPGTGLGMPLMKEIVEAHGGSVSVASELGRGTDVTIRLPIARPGEDQ